MSIVSIPPIGLFFESPSIAAAVWKGFRLAVQSGANSRSLPAKSPNKGAGVGERRDGCCFPLDPGEVLPRSRAFEQSQETHLASAAAHLSRHFKGDDSAKAETAEEIGA